MQPSKIQESTEQIMCVRVHCKSQKMKFFLTLILLAFLMVSCQSQTDSKIEVVSKSEFKQEISKENSQLVDVRTADEFAGGSLPNAVNIDVNGDDFETKIQQLDKTKPVYVYCRSGARSRTAAKKMVELGFTHVIDLEGGYMNWN